MATPSVRFDAQLARLHLRRLNCTVKLMDSLLDNSFGRGDHRVQHRLTAFTGVDPRRSPDSIRMPAEPTRRYLPSGESPILEEQTHSTPGRPRVERPVGCDVGESTVDS